MTRLLIRKDTDAGKDGKQKEKRVTEDEMVRCATAYEPGQTPGDGGEEGGLVCCSPWSHKESDIIGN